MLDFLQQIDCRFIQNSCFTNFNFLVYHFHQNIDHVKRRFNQTVVNQSDQGKVGKMLIENARYGPEKTVSNHLKDTY